MTETVVRIDKLGKRYRINLPEKQPESWRGAVASLLASPFQYLRQMTRPPTAEEILWALKNVSFEVKRGEVVGIIGRNGAGKSTLLKIISRITDPTEGRAIIQGRVGALLEVGTGFHPDLTGRENIYMNGSILGMRKREIDLKFDEIVSFAEVEQFIDTPVKRYSSGMYVRLAFAVAAHLQPEILIVDEVLAVGDAAFQAKCLGKMGEYANEGRTVLFVSHNMGFVARLSQRGILIDEGQIIYEGDIASVITKYNERVLSTNAEVLLPPDPAKRIKIRSVQLLDHHGSLSTQLDREHPFRVVMRYDVNQPAKTIQVNYMLDKSDGTPVCHSSETDIAPEHVIDRLPGTYQATIDFPGSLLNAGAYQIRLGIVSNGHLYDTCNAFIFHLHDYGSFAARGARGRQRLGLLAIPLNWQTEKITVS